MKLVSNKPPHNCQTLANEFQRNYESDGSRIYIGSIVECECGRQLVLAEHQFDGPYWRHVNQGALG